MKWHLRNTGAGNYTAACGRDADLIVDTGEFIRRIASERCRDCDRILSEPPAPTMISADDLAAFMNRERNSLHYKRADASEFNRGYTTAVDAIATRLAREFRTVEGFDAARFLDLCQANQG